LAGPLALFASVLILSGMLTWLPPGAGGVDHIVLPILLFPAIWTGLFFYGCFERSLWRGYALLGGLSVFNILLIAVHTRSVP
jgi:hypothetical protein